MRHYAAQTDEQQPRDYNKHVAKQKEVIMTVQSFNHPRFTLDLDKLNLPYRLHAFIIEDKVTASFSANGKQYWNPLAVIQLYDATGLIFETEPASAVPYLHIDDDNGYIQFDTTIGMLTNSLLFQSVFWMNSISGETRNLVFDACLSIHRSLSHAWPENIIGYGKDITLKTIVSDHIKSGQFYHVVDSPNYWLKRSLTIVGNDVVDWVITSRWTKVKRYEVKGSHTVEEKKTLIFKNTFYEVPAIPPLLTSDF